MAGIRMTGLASGLDTQGLISQLSEAYQKKVDNAKKAQTKAEWKKDAWAGLNTKLQNFYRGALSTFKSSTSYKAKTITGNLSGVKVTAGNNAINGNHKIKVTDVASAQMITGNSIKNTKVNASSIEKVTDKSTALSSLTDENGYSLDTRLNGAEFSVGGENIKINLNAIKDKYGDNASVDNLLTEVNDSLDGTGVSMDYKDGKFVFTNSGDSAVTVTASNDIAAGLGISTEGTEIAAAGGEEGSNVLSSISAYNKVTSETQTNVSASTKLTDITGITEGAIIKVNGKEIKVDRNMTLSSLASEMAKTGINASYDANQGRFYLSSKVTGSDGAFDIEASEEVKKALGLDVDKDSDGKDGRGSFTKAQDATVVYNGVTYTNSSNNFTINGLTFDVTAKGEEMSFTVENDVDGIYNKVKDFLKEYNSLIKEMNDLYNADSSRGYEPLTSEEKEAMTEEDVKNWEDKIKKSLLRRDDTLSNLTSNMRTILNKSVAYTNPDGTTTRYSLSSFGINTGNWSEKGQLHIDGDQDDTLVSGNEDKLKAAIAANPDAVAKTLSSLGTEMYTFLMKAQKKTETSSSQTFYNDVTLDADIKAQKDNVTKMQEKMQAEEDKYYKQFSAMESAMAKLQSQQSYLSGLFGS